MLLLAAVLGLAGGCGSDAERTSPPQRTSERPEQTAQKIVVTETDLGVPRWTLEADKVATYEEKQVALAQNVHVDFFDKRGQRVSTLTSKQGRLDTPENDMTAIGDVVVTNAEGYMLESDSLRWINREEKIRTDAFVRLTRGTDVLTGYGLVSDPSLEHFEILRQVTGRSEREAPEGSE